MRASAAAALAVAGRNTPISGISLSARQGKPGGKYSFFSANIYLQSDDASCQWPPHLQPEPAEIFMCTTVKQLFQKACLNFGLVHSLKIDSYCQDVI